MVGPNGIGKSTFLLLAGGRLLPDSGTVRLLGADTRDLPDEQARNERASFIYQNMEFETDAPLGEVLPQVAAVGGDSQPPLQEVLAVTDLHSQLLSRLQELSKGEMQRAIVAMSILYSSPVVLMDEPLFAVEPRHAEAIMEYLRDDCRRRNRVVVASVHDVHLARSYGDHAVLFFQDGTIQRGSARELLERDTLERAFQAPWDTLHERQALYRRMLREVSEQA